MYFTIDEYIELGTFLSKQFNIKEAKQHLKNGNVIVNNQRITQFHHPLKPQDKLLIMKHTPSFDIVYEDNDVIIVDKKAGIPTIATDKNKENNLYYMVSSYVKKNNKKNKIFVVHRLDKDTSGIVMFAKNVKAKEYLQNNWANFTRKYIALVVGKLTKKHDVLKNYLVEKDNHIVYVSDKGKLAITEYSVIKEKNNQSLLDITIHSGRKNQIRVQLNHIGHPIIGDRKYGHNKADRLKLHAYYLEWIHPVTHQKMLNTLNNEFKL